MSRNFYLTRYLNTDDPTWQTPIDFVFVTALPEERDAVLRHLDDTYEIVQVDCEPLTYYRGHINIPTTGELYEVVVILLLGMGNGEAAVSSMEAIKRWQPASIVMIGIAGGVPDKVMLGDIIVAHFVYYYELAKRTSKGDRRRAQHFSSDDLLYDRARAYTASEWKSDIGIEWANVLYKDLHFPKVHFGAIGSGEKVLADTKTLLKLLNECPELLAIAMEGAGVARAASRQPYRIRFMEVRSICDYANEQKNDDWHVLAAEMAAAFTFGLLRSRPVPPSTAKGNLTKFLIPCTEPLAPIAPIQEPEILRENERLRITTTTSANSTDLWVSSSQT